MSRCRRLTGRVSSVAAGTNNRRNCVYGRDRNTRGDYVKTRRLPCCLRQQALLREMTETQTTRFVRDDKLVARTLLGQMIFHVYEDFLLHSIRLKIRFLDQVQRFLG